MISIKKDNDFVKEIIRSQEGLQLDFKHGITNQLKIAKTMVAFANTKGGKLIIGVSDHRKIIGIDADEEVFMIEQANQKFISPALDLLFEIYEVHYIDDEKLPEELYILVVTIPESSLKPHYLIDAENNKTIYFRQGDKSMPEL
jgi:predicted HTH transcriptional regulator